MDRSMCLLFPTRLLQLEPRLHKTRTNELVRAVASSGTHQ